MTSQSQDKIKKLQIAFFDLTNYKDKINFFDQHFGVLPFRYPSFHPKLNYLFIPEELSNLSTLYEKEKRGNDLLVRKFSFKETLYVFDISPDAINRQILNKFIIDKFLMEDSAFIKQIKKMQDLGRRNKPLIETYLNEAIGLINFITFQKNDSKERSYRNQFMNVFFEGYNDSAKNSIKQFALKKKFIELYLYAQGILFDKYIKALTVLKETKKIEPQKQKKGEEDADLLKRLHTKLLLLKKLEILDFLKYKYAYMEKPDLNRTIGEIVCKITGESIKFKDQVIKEINKPRKK
jgi:hypothetical protein